MSTLHFNHCVAYLDGDIDDTVTTFDIDVPFQEGGVDIPTVAAPDVLRVSIDTEVIYVTAYTSGSTTVATCARGQEGTAEAAHDAGARVYNTPTKLNAYGTLAPVTAADSVSGQDGVTQRTDDSDGGRTFEIVLGDATFTGPAVLVELLAYIWDAGHQHALRQRLQSANLTGSGYAEITDAVNTQDYNPGDNNNARRDLYVEKDDGVYASVSLRTALLGSRRASLLLDYNGSELIIETDSNGGAQLNADAIDMAFNGETPITRPTITGSITSDLPQIVTDLLAALHSLGLVTDATTA